MTGKHLLLAGLAAVGVLTYTMYRFGGGEPVQLAAPAANSDALNEVRKPPGSAKTREQALGSRLRVGGEAESNKDPAGGPPEKLARFERAIERIDDNLSRSYEIDPRRKDTLYQEVTQAFDALSVHLNANDPAHRAYIESARKTMMERLRLMDLEQSRVGDATPPSPAGPPR
jgi:hypothetical protein